MIRPVKRCFVDTETGGTTPRHAVVQIAALVEIGDTTHEFTVECAPFDGDIVDHESLVISGRNVEQVNGYMPAREAHARFVSFLGQHVDKFDRADKLHLIAYNARFDADMLRAWFTKARDNYFGSWFWSAPIDVMSLAADRLIDRRHEFINFKLGTVCESVGIRLDNAHDALADVRAARELYRWCRGEREGVAAA